MIGRTREPWYQAHVKANSKKGAGRPVLAEPDPAEEKGGDQNLALCRCGVLLWFGLAPARFGSDLATALPFGQSWEDLI